MNKKLPDLLPRFSLIILILLAGVAGGITIDRRVLGGDQPFDGVPDAAGPAFRLLAEAWNIIDARYVDHGSATPEELGYGAIRGMVDALGDTGHSRFLSPDMLKKQNEYTQGEFEGIGAYVEMKDGQVFIVAPIDNSPAKAAGLKPGDIILSVNGEDITRGLTLDEIVQQVAGSAGSRVTLVVLDSVTGERRELTLVRAKVELQNLSWQQLPGTAIAYVRIAAFSEGVTDELKQTLIDIEEQGLRGVILDLRNNPGGLLSEAIGTSSQFLNQGQDILLRQDSQGRVKAESTEKDGMASSLPLVVLINEGSASASEIVAGALQDNGRAQLVGTTTFGTGTVLNEFDLSDGSALLLATEQWLTPVGRQIWHEGIMPNVPVALGSSQAPFLPEIGQKLTADELSKSDDAQLLKALELLTSMETKPASTAVSCVTCGRQLPNLALNDRYRLFDVS